MTNAKPTLQIENLSCIRGDRCLFKQLAFSLSESQVVLVEGANGSGKTTLLRVLSGMRQPDEGEVRWCGQSITALKGDYLEQVNYVGHLDGVKRDLTAWENLQFTGDMSHTNGKSIAEVLAIVGLSGQAEQQAGQFSAGQRRRLALARLFLLKAKLWVLDEPFTSLDRAGMHLLETLFSEHVNRGGMIVMSAHHDIALSEIDVQRVNLSA
jgi:heme exporter protein A